MWIVYAALAALCSALVAILTKLGLQGINSHVATAIRTSFVVVVTWLVVWLMGVRGEAVRVDGRQLWYLFLSALATGGAWLFYNRALQLGPATRVASVDKMSIVLIAGLSVVIFQESLSPLALFSLALITGGTVLLLFS